MRVQSTEKPQRTVRPQTAFKIRQFARIIIEKKCTLREAAKEIGVGTAYYHRCVTELLEIVDKDLYLEVRKVLDNNLAARSDRMRVGRGKKVTE